MAPVVATQLAYGLGMFYWLSGQMSAKSLARATPWEFAKSKLWRLGVPTLFYSAFIDPLQEVVLQSRGNLRDNLEAYYKAVLNFKGVTGSCWYTGTLLVLDLCAAILKRCFTLWRGEKMKPMEFSTMTTLYALLSRWGWVAVASGTFFVTKWFPPGKPLPFIHVQGFNVIQYIYCYVLGHMAFHLGMPRMTSLYEKGGPYSKLSMTKAVVISLAAIPIVLLPNYLRNRKSASAVKSSSAADNEANEQNTISESDMGMDGRNMTTALYSTWAALTLCTLAPAHMSVFEQYFITPPKRRLWSTRYSYAAYLLHSPLQWIAGQAIDDLLCPQGKRPAWMSSRAWTELGPILMGGAVSIIDIVASFGGGMLLVDYVPGLNSFL
jgi:glucans biosynthesis protein C